MDVPSAKFLVEQLKVPFIKVGSSDHSNTPLLQYLAAETDTPLIVSTGMADLYQIKSTYDLLRRLRKGSTAKFGLLQCTSAYPTQPEDVNLAVIDSYRDLFPDAVIGYSGEYAREAGTVRGRQKRNQSRACHRPMTLFVACSFFHAGHEIGYVPTLG